MRKVALALAAAAALSGCASAPLPRNENLRIVGRWANGEPGSACREQFEFREDGRVLYTSGGGARVEGTYVLSPNPSARGMHALLMQVVASNGGNDCQGDPAAGGPGDTTSLYLWIDTAKDYLLGCAEDNFDYCDRPLRRVR